MVKASFGQIYFNYLIAFGLPATVPGTWPEKRLESLWETLVSSGGPWRSKVREVWAEECASRLVGTYF